MPKYKDNSDIPGMTTALTAPFILFSVTIIDLWLVLQQGLLNLIMALVIGIIAAIGLIIASRALYANLVDRSVTRPGCLLGLMVYGATFGLLIIVLIWMFWNRRTNPLLWMDLINAALIGVLIIPAASFGAAFWQSSRESGGSGKRPKRSRSKRR